MSEATLTIEEPLEEPTLGTGEAPGTWDETLNNEQTHPGYQGMTLFVHTTKPDNPASGFVKIFGKNNSIYILDHEGNETILDVSLISFGTIAEIPAAGKTPRLYYATDERLIYFDNGESWDAQELPAHTHNWDDDNPQHIQYLAGLPIGDPETYPDYAVMFFAGDGAFKLVTVTWENVSGKPESYPPASHNHDDIYYSEDEIDTLLSGKADSSHTHDDRYFTESEHINNSAGAGDAGKPIKLDGGGHVDASMINDGDISHSGLSGTHNLSTDIDHDQLTGFVANEHIDWTVDQGETNIHSGNIPDLSGAYATAGHDHDSDYYTKTEIDTANYLKAYTGASPYDQSSLGRYTLGTVGESVAVGDVVCLKSDGKFWKADANGSGTYPAWALVLYATDADDTAPLCMPGEFYRDDSFDWTPGQMLYLSETPGGITATAPSSSGTQVQVIGIAYSADVIYFNPQLVLVERV